LHKQKMFLTSQRDKHGEPLHSMSRSAYFFDVENYKLILEEEEINMAVRIVASKIERRFKGENIVLIGVLTGAFVFMGDLCKELKRPYSVQFLKASSYQDKQEQGNLNISLDIGQESLVSTDGTPHKIIIVDELLDNGKTLEMIRHHLLEKCKDTHKESDILTCVLFTKKRERKWPEADICGVSNMPDLWLVGYGLDDRQVKRGWSSLFMIPKVKIVKTIRKDEVDTLLESLDADCTLKKSVRIGNTEIFYKRPPMQIATCLGMQVRGKDHLRELISLVETPLKGKYDFEIDFSFVARGTPLVEEDDVFSGNEKLYAEIRCQLRNQIMADATREGLI